MNRAVRALFSFLMILCLISGVAFADGSSLTVTDQIGREVELNQPAQTIVSCYYISTATLVALGVEDRLTGVEMKADQRPLYQLAASGLIDLPAVGSGKGVNVEEIAALNPDVVILPKRLKDDAQTLEALGLRVIVVNPETREDFEACVALLGEVCGVSDAADALLSRYAALTESVRSLTEEAEKPVVYMASASDCLTTYPAGLYQSDLIDIAGGINAAGELEGDGKVQIDPEQLVAWNPDYIFIVAGADYTAEAFTENEQFASLNAVKNNRVCYFPSDIEAWDYPTPSSVLGEAYMADVLHPGLFGDDGFMAMASDFYREVFGIEITPDDLGL